MFKATGVRITATTQCLELSLEHIRVRLTDINYSVSNGVITKIRQLIA